MERRAGEFSAPIVALAQDDGFQKSPVLPRIGVGVARALYVGPGLALEPHFNVATTIAVALGDPFALRTWSRKHGWSPWHSSLVGVIPSETLHHLKSAGPMSFLYLDPLTDGESPLTEDSLRLGRERLLQAGPQLTIPEAFAAFGLAARVPRDARIANVISAIERHPEAFGRLQEAAKRACLSPSRFRARFNAELGLPFRRYRLWRRMAAVMRTLAGGGNLTEAALVAGFSSPAHLSTAFKRMFGVAPRELLALGVAIDIAEEPLTAT